MNTYSSHSISVGRRCCAALNFGGAAAPPYRRLSYQSPVKISAPAAIP